VDARVNEWTDVRMHVMASEYRWIHEMMIGCTSTFRRMEGEVNRGIAVWSVGWMCKQTYGWIHTFITERAND
jgi:hypothetical protein